MQLLSGNPEVLTEGNVTITTIPVTPRMQAKIVDLDKLTSMEALMDLCTYILTECVSEIKVNDKSFNPTELAQKADLRDLDTLKSFVTIKDLVVQNALLKAEDEKKS